MVDSENSTSLSSVSRRALLGTIVTAPLAYCSGLASPDSTLATDPVLLLWEDWQSAFAEATVYGAKWAALESMLARSIGFPRVVIPTSPGRAEVWVISHERIDEELRDMPASEDLRRQLRSDLATQQARWDAAAEQSGLDTADHQEEAALNRSAEIAAALFELPARSTAGVIVKLELILRIGQTQSDDDEFPWGQLRTTIADLRRLVSAGCGI